MRFDVYIHSSDADILARIEHKLDLILQKEKTIMATQADLQAAVDAVITAQTAETDAATAMAAVLASNTQMLRDLLASGGTPAEIIAQLNDLVAVQEANRQAYVDATLANTQPPTP